MAKQGPGGISWTDETWNPLRGCTRVSEGCRHCYAERVAARFSGPGQAYEGLAVLKNGEPRWLGEVRFVQEHLYDPLRWRKGRTVFVNSMSDLYHERVPDDWRDLIYAVMLLSDRGSLHEDAIHRFQILTKRPVRMADYLRDPKTPERVWWAIQGMLEAEKVPLSGADRHWAMVAFESAEALAWPPRRVIHGTSVEDQKTANFRIEAMRDVPGKRFLSMEPLLGPVDLSPWLVPPIPFDQVIVGGESGPDSRPLHREWVRTPRDQCVPAGVRFHFKQWGEWIPYGQISSEIWHRATRFTLVPLEGAWDGRTSDDGAATAHLDGNEHFAAMAYLGKHQAGRILDGRIWDEMPSFA